MERGIEMEYYCFGIRKEVEMMECIVCGRKKLFPTEGRVIDGSWYNDKYIPKSYWGEWVCSYRCYEKLIEKL